MEEIIPINFYKELVVRGKEGVVFGLVADKKPEAHSVKIRAHVSLVSPGTENYYIQQCVQHGDMLKLGYASSGVIEETGKNVNRFQKGDRVIAMGWQKAIHAEKIFVPQNLCCKIPETLSFEDAVFANLGATAVHAIHRAELNEKDTVLVIGGGIIGQLISLYAYQKTCRVFLSDLVESRMEIAHLGGIKTVSVSDWSSFFKMQKITKAFLCLSGEATQVFYDLFPLIDPGGNGIHRSKIIGVGRFTAKIDFNVALGNIDIVYAARCGEGYRNIEYEMGKTEVDPIAGEQNVQQNLLYCLDQIYKGEILVEHLKSRKVPFEKALEKYESFTTEKSVIGILLQYNNIIH